MTEKGLHATGPAVSGCARKSNITVALAAATACSDIQQQSILTDPPSLDERPPTTRAPTPSKRLLGELVSVLREIYK
jgi:hypothetical protein